MASMEIEPLPSPFKGDFFFDRNISDKKAILFLPEISIKFLFTIL